MNHWFDTLAAGRELSIAATSELQERGFVVLPGPVPFDRMHRLVNAYEACVASATGDDVRIGSTTTRVGDFVNRGTEFDDLYVFPPLLEACCRVIRGPFKLSSLHARTLRPGMPAVGDCQARSDKGSSGNTVGRHGLNADYPHPRRCDYSADPDRDAGRAHTSPARIPRRSNSGTTLRLIQSVSAGCTPAR
jgi:hypothetical protein